MLSAVVALSEAGIKARGEKNARGAMAEHPEKTNMRKFPTVLGSGVGVGGARRSLFVFLMLVEGEQFASCETSASAEKLKS